FDRKQDADRFDAEVTRRRQLGALATLDSGRGTLDEFVTEVWAPSHGVTLAPKTRRNYAGLYDHHIAASLGSLPLREIRAETIALRWGDVRDNTLLVQRALSLGSEEDTKTTAHRTVRLLGPLRADLAEWGMASGRPDHDALVFPSRASTTWSEPAYQSWRRRA